MAKIKQLSVCGVPVPFDGLPRLAEIEAYDAAVREGGKTLTLVQHIAPAIINTRAKPGADWAWTPDALVTEETVLAVLDVMICIEVAMNSPKVKARLEEVTNLIQNRETPRGKASASNSPTTTTTARKA